tara:strand:- start:180 stop:425 length:246 start_codon:yes stop_codon:yes gene_type:complete
MRPKILELTKLLEKGINVYSQLHQEINKLIAERVCAFCKYPNLKFRDELSKKEYKISALCQDCQDDMFGKEVGHEYRQTIQ